MSRAYYLTCPSLGIYINIGQGTPTKQHQMLLYSGKAKTIDALRRFFNFTKGRVLRLVDEHWENRNFCSKWKDFEKVPNDENEICGNCGNLKKNHYGFPEDSCYGKIEEVFESCNPKEFWKEIDA